MTPLNDRLDVELRQVRGDLPLLRAEDVVEWARKNKRSALHTQFNWNDRDAAERYRIDQARALIRLIVIPGTRRSRYVSLTIDRVDSGGYRDVEIVMRSSALRAVRLRDALLELNRIRQKYAELEELTAVFAAIDAANPERARAA